MFSGQRVAILAMFPDRLLDLLLDCFLTRAKKHAAVPAVSEEDDGEDEMVFGSQPEEVTPRASSLSLAEPRGRSSKARSGGGAGLCMSGNLSPQTNSFLPVDKITSPQHLLPLPAQQPGPPPQGHQVQRHQVCRASLASGPVLRFGSLMLVCLFSVSVTSV